MTQAQLTPKEKQVIEQMALGKTNQEIGEALGSAAETVKAHVAKILLKLGASNRLQAVLKYQAPVMTERLLEILHGKAVNGKVNIDKLDADIFDSLFETV